VANSVNTTRAGAVTTRLHTVCLIQDRGRVLLLDRRDHPNIRGYIAPGGKIDFPESPVEGAIREVREETGLRVSGLVYKGLHEFVNPDLGERYMVFNYLATTIEGELLTDPPEGRLQWVSIEDALSFPLERSFRARFPYFFEPGTFEIHMKWGGEAQEETVVRT